MPRKKTLWEATESKTNRQITLWVITLVTMVVFSNNVIQFYENIVNNPGVAGVLNLFSFIGLRIIFGYLFDRKQNKKKTKKKRR